MPDWIGTFKSWTTVVASLRVEVDDAAVFDDRIYGWLDASTARALEREHRERTTSTLDVAAALVEATLPQGILEVAVGSGENFYFSAPARPTFSWGHITVGAMSGSASRERGKLNLDLLTERLGGLDTVIAATPDVTSVAQWSGYVVGEADPVKQFFFAVFGLETLVHSLYATSRETVMEALSVGAPLPVDTDLPAAELLAPRRTLAFQFALVATSLSPTTAAADVEQFRVVKKARTPSLMADRTWLRRSLGTRRSRSSADTSPSCSIISRSERGTVRGTSDADAVAT